MTTRGRVYWITDAQLRELGGLRHPWRTAILCGVAGFLAAQLLAWFFR